MEVSNITWENILVVVESKEDRIILDHPLGSPSFYSNYLIHFFLPGFTKFGLFGDPACSQLQLKPMYGAVYKWEAVSDILAEKMREVPVGSFCGFLLSNSGGYSDYKFLSLYASYGQYKKEVDYHVNKILKDYGCKIVRYSSMPHTTGSVCGDRGD